jgi:hypothetical protein
MSDLIPPMMPDDLDALIQAMERVQQLEADVARLRLTDEEREAMMRAMYRVVGADSAILWSLLERTK